LNRLRIEQTGPSSAALMAQVHAECFQPFWSEREIAAMLHMKTTLGFLMRQGDRPVGMALLRLAIDEAEVLTIGIIPDLRGKGAGARLLARGERDVAQSGARRLFLEVSVENAPARALYQRLGYSQIGRRRGYYGDGSDALVLEKALSGDGQGLASAPINPD
jgi:[ribosomal protein S18]-alanine N-acetyltransferase